MTKKITKVLLPLLMLGIVLFSIGCQLDVTNASRLAEVSKYEEKIYWTGNIDEKFDGSSVLVVLDKYTGGINKQHDKGLFGGFEKEYIKDLTAVTEDIKTSLIDEVNFRQIFEIKLPGDSKENVINVIHELEKIDGILSAEPNYIGEVGTTSNDPMLLSQWGLTGTAGVQVADAWDITKGSNSVRVGIIDTGIANHPDLNANLVAGWNFVSNNSNTNDTDGHGTHVAGIVGAVGNNTTGISGVCWNVSLVPLKISGPTTEVINAISYATTNNIKILNLSWWNFPHTNAFRSAIDNYTGLFVCIAGNGSANTDVSPNYPGSYVLDNLISVGSIDSNGSPSYFTNYGAKSVDVFAPGGNILSTYTGNGYASMSGTSMAAPHVAGVAALIISARQGNGWSAPALKTYIESSVNSIPALLCVSGGRLDAYKALLAAKGYRPPPYTISFGMDMYGGPSFIADLTIKADGSYEIEPTGFEVLMKPYYDKGPLDTIYENFGGSSIPWSLTHYLIKNNMPSIVIPCTLVYPAINSNTQTRYIYEADIEITIDNIHSQGNGNLPEVTNVFEIREVEEVYGGDWIPAALEVTE